MPRSETPVPLRPAAAWAGDLRFTIAREVESLTEALESLKRQANLAFITLLVVYGTFFAVMLLAAFAFLIAFAVGADSIVLGVSAGVAASGLAGFVAVLMSPMTRRQQRLAILIGQTEGARSAMHHNQKLWDAYLQTRGTRVKAEEIAIAVRSLSLSSQSILADLVSGKEAREPARATAPPLPRDGGAVNPAVAAKY
jgi:hypothetical protein